MLTDSGVVAMSSPYGTMRKALVSSYEQQRRSWYVFLFRFPWAEVAVSQNDFAFVDRLWEDWSVHVPTEELSFAKATLRQPGVLTAALSYYRCLMDSGLHDPLFAEPQRKLESGRITVETLYLHGEQDGCIGVEIMNGMEQFFDAGLKKVVIPGGGHFIHLERPSEVNALIRRFLD